jgi:hypothetical protein
MDRQKRIDVLQTQINAVTDEIQKIDQTLCRGKVFNLHSHLIEKKVILEKHLEDIDQCQKAHRRLMFYKTNWSKSYSRKQKRVCELEDILINNKITFKQFIDFKKTFICKHYYTSEECILCNKYYKIK